MTKKKIDENIQPPTTPANLSQNKDKKRKISAGAINGSGIGAGQGTK